MNLVAVAMLAVVKDTGLLRSFSQVSQHITDTCWPAGETAA